MSTHNQHRPGDPVEVFFNGKWYAGTFIGANQHGKFDVALESGGTATNSTADEVRPRQHRPIEQMDAEIAMLRDQLKAAESRRAEARRALAESVKPVYRFTLTPGRETDYHFHGVMDESVTLWRLDGQLENADECAAAGKKPLTGGMIYYFNQATGKFIASTGGGSVWVSSGGFSREITSEMIRTFDELADFIAAHPAGGDVTSIIEAHRTRSGRD